MFSFLALGLLAQSINYYLVQKDETVLCMKEDALPRYLIKYQRNFLSLRSHSAGVEAIDPFAAAYVADSLIGRGKQDQLLKSGYTCNLFEGRLSFTD